MVLGEMGVQASVVRMHPSGGLLPLIVLVEDGSLVLLRLESPFLALAHLQLLRHIRIAARVDVLPTLMLGKVGHSSRRKVVRRHLVVCVHCSDVCVSHVPRSSPASLVASVPFGRPRPLNFRSPFLGMNALARLAHCTSVAVVDPTLRIILRGASNGPDGEVVVLSSLAGLSLVGEDELVLIVKLVIEGLVVHLVRAEVDRDV